ncbi:helix-turn-helix transcriptional regulator [Streptomyces caniscabiei]|uniref:helix-turn-helix transcriptional regulator n=1 Tax=Streptomyces caniscabiei TaxID=2746961 RepID=UPI0029B61290|nr:helix-turn-helix transcriptional regulator [Streptomyces caniscabiei]MDX2602594.1 helix-turn-helix transcriptional regulator [Streptomyces caniscabiei]MDX2734450.1 helix-turn-helix transcriptional regulator [Streptomyces caniscabiei]MDX2776901.1 helix-turn-helix transcriptional regulator [Streptomyces caniscabiei]
MDRSSEIREFLRTRRARITPERAGLAPHGGPRRVPGLRREEVAQLAGVSVDYYIRLERGRTQGVSEAVLTAVARALCLDETERAHLFDLAQPTATTRARRKRPLAPQRVHPVLHRTLDSLAVPAIVQGRRTDVLAANRLARALYTDFEARPHRERNFARFVFLDEAARALYADWERVAGDCLAMLRLYAGRHPDDPRLTELIGELSLHSDTFRRMWADHDVQAHTTGTKRLHHPIVGDLTLDYLVLAVEGDPEQTLTVYTTEPASPSAEALTLLAEWTDTSAVRPRAPEEKHNPVG